MKREFSCYQWIIRDNQQMSFNEYFLTEDHFVNRKDVDKYWSPQVTEYCFHPIRPLRESKFTGKFAESVYWHEQDRRDEKVRELLEKLNVG